MLEREGRIVSITGQDSRIQRTVQNHSTEGEMVFPATSTNRIKNLLKTDHIKKLKKITDEIFIQPVVITVQNDRNVQIALDARSLNNAIFKNEYQMTDLGTLMDKIAEVITNKKEGNVLFNSFTSCTHTDTQNYP